MGKDRYRLLVGDVLDRNVLSSEIGRQKDVYKYHRLFLTKRDMAVSTAIKILDRDSFLELGLVSCGLFLLNGRRFPMLFALLVVLLTLYLVFFSTVR